MQAHAAPFGLCDAYPCMPCCLQQSQGSNSRGANASALLRLLPAAPGGSPQQAQQAQRRSKEPAGVLGRYNGADTLAGVRVYTVLGLHVSQSAVEAGFVQFTPAFLSPGQVSG